MDSIVSTWSELWLFVAKTNLETLNKLSSLVTQHTLNELTLKLELEGTVRTNSRNWNRDFEYFLSRQSGYEDQGLYRVVGVASKVTKLLTMGLDKRKSEKARYIFCHYLSDWSSVFKTSLFLWWHVIFYTVGATKCDHFETERKRKW